MLFFLLKFLLLYKSHRTLILLPHHLFQPLAKACQFSNHLGNLFYFSSHMIDLYFTFFCCQLSLGCWYSFDVIPHGGFLKWQNVNSLRIQTKDTPFVLKVLMRPVICNHLWTHITANKVIIWQKRNCKMFLGVKKNTYDVIWHEDFYLS